jgi:drug/metabolite transporter (DMT)-like permease
MKKDWLLFLLPGLIWGASFLFIAEGLEATGPYGVTFVRYLVGFAALAAFPAARQSIGRSGWLGIAALGLFWMAFPQTLFALAEQRVNTAITGMLNAAVPFFATLVAVFIARRAPARHIVLGLLVGFVGAPMIAAPTASAGGSSTIGVLMILAAVMSYGVAVNIARPLQQRYGALPVIWRAQAIALVLTAPFGVPEVLSARWSLWPVLSLLALGALGTGVAFVLTAVVAGRMGAPVASAIAFLIPPVALLLGVLVRGEEVALISALGAAVCIVGAVLMQRKPAQRLEEEEKVLVKAA